MSTEAAESKTGRRGFPNDLSRGGRHNDLPSMRCRAHAGGGMDGQADVPDIRECRMAAVDPDTHPHLQIVGPGVVAERSLDGHRRLDRCRGTFEDREEFVGPRIDSAAAPA